jgi:hypothetical protein
LGKSSILLTISALENYRKQEEHLHTNDAEAVQPLRADQRIRTLETEAKKNEPARRASAQVLKAAGSSAGTYSLG